MAKWLKRLACNGKECVKASPEAVLHTQLLSAIEVLSYSYVHF